MGRLGLGIIDPSLSEVAGYIEEVGFWGGMIKEQLYPKLINATNKNPKETKTKPRDQQNEHIKGN